MTLAHVEPAMGTMFSFNVEAGDLDPAAVRQVVVDACLGLHRHDALFSLWRADSPMSDLRKGGNEEEIVSRYPEIAEVLDLCMQAKEMSSGWFDPWRMPGGLDPTGLVKGWAVDAALGALIEGGVSCALVNGGGDIAVCGTELRQGGAWLVGIRHPWRAGSLACTVKVTSAIATSGCYERGAHLVNPRSHRCGSAVSSASVCGPSLAMADALATALAIAGDEMLTIIDALGCYEAYVVRHDGTESWTAGMPFAE